MPGLDKRVEDLPPKRRQILEAFLARKGTPVPGAMSDSNVPAASEHLALDASSPSEPSALKASYKRFYDGVSAQLANNVFGEFSFFLNYGYMSDGLPEYAAAALPDHYINKNSVKLVLELIGDVPVTGKRVLDVGCGRGGT